MNRNEVANRRKEMIKQAEENNSNITKAKKFILKISIIWVILRLVHIVFEYYVALKFGQDYSTAVTNTVMLVVLALFIIGIYQGTKGLAILPILGSVVSIIRDPEIFTYIAEVVKVGDILLLSYYFVFIFVMLMQAALMILILVNKNCKEYFNVMTDITRQLQGNYARKL